jgi:hypothetical protein
MGQVSTLPALSADKRARGATFLSNASVGVAFVFLAVAFVRVAYFLLLLVVVKSAAAVLRLLVVAVIIEAMVLLVRVVAAVI